MKSSTPPLFVPSAMRRFRMIRPARNAPITVNISFGVIASGPRLHRNGSILSLQIQRMSVQRVRRNLALQRRDAVPERGLHHPPPRGLGRAPDVREDRHVLELEERRMDLGLVL